MQQNKKLKKDVDFPIPGTLYEKVKSKMHKFNSRNARIPEVQERHPTKKKRVQQKQLKRVDAIKEMCLITFHSLHS